MLLSIDDMHLQIPREATSTDILCGFKTFVIIVKNDLAIMELMPALHSWFPLRLMLAACRLTCQAVGFSSNSLNTNRSSLVFLPGFNESQPINI